MAKQIPLSKGRFSFNSALNFVPAQNASGTPGWGQAGTIQKLQSFLTCAPAIDGISTVVATLSNNS